MKTMRKLMAALTSAVIMTALSASIPTDATTQSKAYRKYVFSTGQITNYTLTQTDQTPASVDAAPDSMRAYIYGDDRVDTGIDGVVRLSIPLGNGYMQVGTGCIIDDHTIATCAHILYDPVNYASNNGYAPSVTVVFYDNTGATNGSTASGVEFHVPVDYINPTGENNDYALVTVNTDLSAYTHFDLGYAYDVNTTDFSALDIFVTGVASYLNSPPYHLKTGKGHSCLTHPSTDINLRYTADTDSGTSGGPVYMATRYTYGSNQYLSYTLLAIHDGGTVDDSNYGRRIDSTLMQFYKGNSNISY
jgi:V8-like Glu-specific endopeptidase